jgi:TetR/AcrR family transcriptional regulator, cholesterol catabolism regulator
MARRVNAHEKRREIVTQAAAVFDTEGYHTTNVETVARVAGLKKPTLYHYFSGKDEILFWIHEEFIDLLIGKHQAREGERLSAAMSVREVMSDVLQLMDTHRGHVRVFFEHHRELAPERQKTIAAKRDLYASLVETDILRGVRAGEFRALDPRLTTLALFGMCNWAYQWYDCNGPRTSRAIAEFFSDLLLEGLRLKD